MMTTAPGRLELVRAFVNTCDLDQGTDVLGDVAGLKEWLVQHGLLQPDEEGAVTETDRSHAVAAREAFRELLLNNNDGRPVDPSALTTLNDVGTRAGVALRLVAASDVRLEALAPGVDGALGRLLLIAHEAMERGEWDRLKACRNDSCQWGFYDRSKNRSKTWCRMEVCGSQVKSRAYRARRRAQAAPRS